MNDFFPVSQSIFSTDALKVYVDSHYSLGKFVDCRFLMSGLNHTYLLKTEEEKYIFRIYRVNWRSLEAIRCELAALLFMANNGASVSTPIADALENYIQVFNAPEGKRYGVLFSYAPGKPKFDDEAQAILYGKNMAKFHNASTLFQSKHKRLPLDLEQLITLPLASIGSYLQERPKDVAYLEVLVAKLLERLEALPLADLEKGYCHGDFHFGNAHITEEAELTFIDFDFSGFGWRAYDLAVYRWGLYFDDKTNFWPHFLEAYLSVRSLSELDISALPLFVLVRQVWAIGLHTSIAHQWGEGYLEGFVNKELERLHNFELEFLS